MPTHKWFQFVKWVCLSGHLCDISNIYFDCAIFAVICTDVKRRNLGLIIFERTTTKRGNCRILRKFIFT